MSNVVITGASRGIGLALTKLYLARGDSVYALCREATDELRALDVQIVEGVDVADTDNLRQALSPLDKVQIDLLINNAGVLCRDGLETWDPQSVELQFKVNALGPLLVTQCLSPHLHKGSKVAMITSRMGSMADNGSGGYYGYRMSKAALNALGVSMARDMAERGIAVALLHPGYVQTRMVGFGGDVSAEESARGLMARIDELNMQNSGQFWHAKGDVLPW
ncbi:SDR family oxidoreductase [Aliiglaciecola sp. CAU 1673]|uniref:SDR family oxidoreductase n=1 Tax=Aliiglaciecola sp. CAU 1673 TaxID=3032595 RepID=UPI0023DB2F8C|nr:SDR family oxidoreductase [Aliiglaciecola sp. CAU 1673]MDF2179986.1 SDR family oxidoreductase [Aliiglaciecola sp. CAU 1673]